MLFLLPPLRVVFVVPAYFYGVTVVRQMPNQQLSREFALLRNASRKFNAEGREQRGVFSESLENTSSVQKCCLATVS